MRKQTCWHQAAHRPSEARLAPRDAESSRIGIGELVDSLLKKPLYTSTCGAALPLQKS